MKTLLAIFVLSSMLGLTDSIDRQKAAADLAATQEKPRTVWYNEDGTNFQAKQINYDENTDVVTFHGLGGVLIECQASKLNSECQDSARNWLPENLGSRPRDVPFALTVKMIPKQNSRENTTWSTSWGSHITDYYSFSSGTVILDSMSLTDRKFKIRAIFFGGETVVTAMSTMVSLPAKTNTTIDVFGNAYAHVEDYVALGIYLQDGHFINTYAIAVEDETGQLLDVRASTTALEESTRANYGKIVLDIRRLARPPVEHITYSEKSSQ